MQIKTPVRYLSPLVRQNVRHQKIYKKNLQMVGRVWGKGNPPALLVGM